MEISLAIKRPFSDVKNLLIGIGIATLSSVGIFLALFLLDTSFLLALVVGGVMLFIPFFITLGYYLENAKRAAKKDYKSVEWSGFGKFLKTGFTASVIGFVYSIPLLLVMIFTIGLPLAELALSGQEPDITTLIGLGTNLVFGVLITFILAIFLAYLLPAASISYAMTGKFKSAFDFKTIKKRAFNADYFVAWIIGVGYTIVISLVFALVFFFLPPLGAGLGAFISSVTMYSLLGRAWGSAK